MRLHVYHFNLFADDANSYEGSYGFYDADCCADAAYDVVMAMRSWYNALSKFENQIFDNSEYGLSYAEELRAVQATTQFYVKRLETFHKKGCKKP